MIIPWRNVFHIIIGLQMILLSTTTVPAQAQTPSAFRLGAGDKAIIVIANNAALPDRTAARELSDYLTRATGASLTVEEEKTPAAKRNTATISIGNTQFAREAGLNANTLKAEECVLQVTPNALILMAGTPRGTLQGTYRFLEEYVGVRWWNPWEETVPAPRTLALPALKKQTTPTFRYRDIYMNYGNDGGRFAVRNRLNRDGDAPISAEYGGGRDYGPPYHVHTLYRILSPAQYYTEHPDWFIVPEGGQPTALNSQLNMSHPAMRQEFLKLLRELIRNAHRDAHAKGVPPPDVYSVSQEDNWIGFATPANKALVEQNGGAESAIILDFVNFLADGIKDEFPDIYIDTLAYLGSEQAPTKIKPRDNVIIRLTDTQSNMLLPVTHERNRILRDNIISWSKITKNLRLWDYAITYTFHGLPMPTTNTYAPDLRFFAEHGVEGIFMEHEEPILADMRDLKVWIQCKLFEDPQRDYNALVREFTDGFYGTSAPHIREYLALLHTQALRPNAQGEITDLTWYAPLHQHKYLTADFFERANILFQRAADAVAGDVVLTRRVNHARLSVDRAILSFYPKLMSQWVAQGKTPATMPLQRKAIGERAQQTWLAQAELRLLEPHLSQQRQAAQNVIDGLTFGPDYMPLPARFRDVPADRIFVYNPSATRNYENRAKNRQDDSAELGVTTRFEIPEIELERYKSALPWGVYDTVSKKVVASGEIKAAEITGDGYHWYKVGTTTLSPYSFLYVMWAWIVQIDLDDAFAKQHPDQKFDVWLSLKFEGPAYGKEKTSAVSLERVVLVKQEG